MSQSNLWIDQIAVSISLF